VANMAKWKDLHRVSLLLSGERPLAEILPELTALLAQSAGVEAGALFLHPEVARLLKELKAAAHITVRIHRADRTIYLYVDGSLVKQWRDPIETLGPGTCLRFVNQGPNLVKLSNLVVSEWDGRLDVQTNVVNNITNDVVRLLNRDTLAGTVEAVQDGQVKISTAFGPMRVPLDRVEQIHFAQAGRDKLMAGGYNLEAQFAKRGHLVLKLEGWEDGRLVASSPVFGQARFSLAAFRLLEWKEAGGQ